MKPRNSSTQDGISPSRTLRILVTITLQAQSVNLDFSLGHRGGGANNDSHYEGDMLLSQVICTHDQRRWTDMVLDRIS